MLGILMAIVAGLAAGAVLGFIGAGGTVIGLPILLLGGGLKEHVVLGTNAIGVAGAALLLALWYIHRGQSQWREGLVFAIPGLAGIFLGARMGLAFPGRHLIFILGFVLFAVAIWMAWLSMQKKPLHTEPSTPDLRALAHLSTRLIPLGLIVGWISGFFAIGGGFMIVPALMLGGEMPLSRAASTTLVPVTLFAAFVGTQYATAGQADLPRAGIMVIAGIVAGAIGIRSASRVPRNWLQRFFAVLLVAIGVYFIIR